MPDTQNLYLFFAASLLLNLTFLPQFIDTSSGSLQLQLLTLGLWFNVQGTLILIIAAYILGKTKSFFRQNQKVIKFQEKLTGVILIGLGIKLALTSKKLKLSFVIIHAQDA